ncbi:MAG: MFS transporter [Clostridiales bacterium]|nr:MFS transporter [Clostridiales bacterium]
MKNPFKYFFSKEAQEGYVPNRDLFAYAVGLAGQNMTYSFQTSWWYYFCTTILRIDPVKVGYVQGASRVWDAVNDPLVGALIDRRRCKSGEKLRPYLIKTPPFIAILSVILFCNFHLSENAALGIIVVVYLAWDMIYSVQDVALWGMIALSSPHSHERSRVSQWVTIGAGAGSALVSAFLLLDSQSFRDAAGLSESAVILIGALIFGFGGEMISMSAYKTKELVHIDEKPKENIWQAITVLRHNKTLLLISLARFFGMMLSGIDWKYFFKSSVSFNIGGLTLDGETSELVYSTVCGIPGAVALLFAMPVIDKIGGMKKLLITSECINIVLRIISYFVGFTSAPRIIIVTVLMAAAQVLLNMKDIAHRSLTSDSIDYIEWKTGQRTEGISFSVQNLISKLSDAGKSIVKGYIMRYIGYDSSLDLKNQGEKFNKAQWPLFILSPVVGAVLYVIIIAFINDDKEQKAFIEKELRSRRGTPEEEKAEVL